MKGIFNIFGFGLLWLVLAPFTLGLSVLVGAALLIYLFVGAEARRENAEEKLQSTLMTGESIVSGSIQHRAFALFHRRLVLAITNSRVILIRRGLLGGFKMTDIQWKDLKDVKMEQNVLDTICGSNLSFEHYNSNVGWLGVAGIRSEAASEIYSHAQAEEQAWEEKRRVRAMEEVRAAAGGVTVHAASAPAAPTQPQATANRPIVEQIQQAKALLDDGVISDSEFQEMKSKILAGA